MKSDPEFNVRFLQLVKSYPQLYNSKLDSYANKRECDKAWKEISNILNETVVDCMSKWTTLRNNFNRSLREKANNNSYYLSKYMQFLLPHLKPRKHTGYFADKFPKECNDTSRESESIQEKESIHHVETSNFTEKDHHSLEQEDDESSDDNDDNVEDSTSIPASDLKRKAKAKICDGIETAFISYVEAKKRPKSELPKNSDMDFFQSLLPYLENLNDYEKITLRISVMETLKELIEKKNHKL